MRITVTIPDEYGKGIKSNLGKKGFVTMSDYVLNLIRADQQQSDVPKEYKGISLQQAVTRAGAQYLAGSITSRIRSNEEHSEWPTSYLGKPLSGRKADCPICYKSVPTEFAQSHYQKVHGDI